MGAQQRLTTHEVAAKLKCYPREAVPLLKAAGIPYVRCGPAYLWDSERVHHLLDHLTEKANG